METVVNREAFLRSLESVKPGLAQREIVEQSTCFVFKDGEVVTYNDEASCRGPSMLPKSFSGAVQAANLLEVLRRIEADEIRVAADGDVFAISVKGTMVECALEADIRLPLNAVDKPGDFIPLHQDFAEALNLVQQCAGKDETRFLLTLVHIAPKWIEACDDYQAARWRIKTGVKTPTLVKRTAVASAGALGVCELSEGENWVHFRNARGFVLSCRRFADEYPSDSITPALEEEGHPITLPKALKDAADLANIFSQESADVNLVRVDVKPGSPGRVTVTGQGITGKVRRSLAANWGGEPIAFMIPPALLGELTSRHNEVLLSNEILKVEGSSYVYVSMLSSPEEVAAQAAPEGGKKKGKRNGKEEAAE